MNIMIAQLKNTARLFLLASVLCVGGVESYGNIRGGGNGHEGQTAQIDDNHRILQDEEPSTTTAITTINSSSVLPPPATANPPEFDTIITSEDCPATMPPRGDFCIVPSGFQYQFCYYPPPKMTDGDDGTTAITRCSCRADEGRLMCVTITLPPPPPTSSQPPIIIPVPTPLPPTPRPTTEPTTTATATATITTNSMPSPVPVIMTTPPTTRPSLPSAAIPSFNNNLAPHCYVAGTSDQLPLTGDGCYVPDTLDYSNCVFASPSTDPTKYRYTVQRCICNPRELPDENYRDKFICNIILNEPL